MKKRVLIDFDGVIHSYISGWVEGMIPDDPIPGAIKWLRQLIIRPDIEPVIWTSRVHGRPDAPIQIRNWLYQHGLTPGEAEEITITSEKMAAHMIIDDRGFRYQGVFPTPEDILNFEPWKPPLWRQKWSEQYDLPCIVLIFRNISPSIIVEACEEVGALFMEDSGSDLCYVVELRSSAGPELWTKESLTRSLTPGENNESSNG